MLNRVEALSFLNQEYQLNLSWEMRYFGSMWVPNTNMIQEQFTLDAPYYTAINGLPLSGNVGSQVTEIIHVSLIRNISVCVIKRWNRLVVYQICIPVQLFFLEDIIPVWAYLMVYFYQFLEKCNTIFWYPAIFSGMSYRPTSWSRKKVLFLHFRIAHYEQRKVRRK